MYTAFAYDLTSQSTVILMDHNDCFDSIFRSVPIKKVFLQFIHTLQLGFLFSGNVKRL